MAGHAERPRILSLHAADLHLPSASVGTPPAGLSRRLRRWLTVIYVRRWSSISAS